MLVHVVRCALGAVIGAGIAVLSSAAMAGPPIPFGIDGNLCGQPVYDFRGTYLSLSDPDNRIDIDDFGVGDHGLDVLWTIAVDAAGAVTGSGTVTVGKFGLGFTGAVPVAITGKVRGGGASVLLRVRFLGTADVVFGGIVRTLTIDIRGRFFMNACAGSGAGQVVGTSRLRFRFADPGLPNITINDVVAFRETDVPGGLYDERLRDPFTGLFLKDLGTCPDTVDTTDPAADLSGCDDLLLEPDELLLPVLDPVTHEPINDPAAGGFFTNHEKFPRRPLTGLWVAGFGPSANLAATGFPITGTGFFLSDDMRFSRDSVIDDRDPFAGTIPTPAGQPIAAPLDLTPIPFTIDSGRWNERQDHSTFVLHSDAPNTGAMMRIVRVRTDDNADRSEITGIPDGPVDEGSFTFRIMGQRATGDIRDAPGTSPIFDPDSESENQDPIAGGTGDTGGGTGGDGGTGGTGGGGTGGTGGDFLGLTGPGGGTRFQL